MNTTNVFLSFSLNYTVDEESQRSQKQDPSGFIKKREEIEKTAATVG